VECPMIVVAPVTIHPHDRLPDNVGAFDMTQSGGERPKVMGPPIPLLVPGRKSQAHC
jgi:hypothetical protein